MFGYSVGAVVAIIIIAGIGFLAMLAKFYRKVEQGTALIRNGLGKTRVAFTGIFVIPIVHRMELMDITVKHLTIDRRGSEGLICKDNMRADIKVAFFVRVNKTPEDVLKVAQSIGCVRASHNEALRELFEAKFSEALKTVGKHFDFVDLYNSREQFKEQILRVIGTDLNGFVLDDAAIDFLEQTPVEKLDADNILDSEGIKKITELTAKQQILANQLRREREKVITQQDVDGKEAILELNRQLTETEARQKREVESVQAREEAETEKIRQEERLKAENAKITTDEELSIASENRDRQVVVAKKNKERTEAIETERVEKDRLIEATERERIVELARIEKDKALEVERKNIQNVIRDRVMVEKTVVEEQERIKDTQAFAEADREKRVALTQAEKEGEEAMTRQSKVADAARKAAEIKAEEEMFTRLKAAEASRKAAELKAEETVVEAEAFQKSAVQKSEGQKLLAEGEAAELAAAGIAEARVEREKNELIEQKGTAEIKVLELRLTAEAKGIDNKGAAEAKAMELKLMSEAKGIESKANAMKLLDAVGREHEEFKLELEKEKEVALARMGMDRDVAKSQAEILGSFLRYAKIDIVGGESAFFDRVMNAVSTGKTVDRYMDSSRTLKDVKETFFNADPEYFQSQLKRFMTQFGVGIEDVKNLTVSAALAKMIALAQSSEQRGDLYGLMAVAERAGIADRLLNLKGADAGEKE